MVKLKTAALAAIIAAAPLFGSQGTGSFASNQAHVDAALFAPDGAAARGVPAALETADRVLMAAAGRRGRG